MRDNSTDRNHICSRSDRGIDLRGIGIIILAKLEKRNSIHLDNIPHSTVVIAGVAAVLISKLVCFSKRFFKSLNSLVSSPLWRCMREDSIASWSTLSRKEIINACSSSQSNCLEAKAILFSCRTTKTKVFESVARPKTGLLILLAFERASWTAARYTRSWGRAA